MSVKEDSGVSSNSTTPAISPRVDVLRSLADQQSISSDAGMNMAYQHAIQMEMFSQLHMMNIMGQMPLMPSTFSAPDMQRMLVENQSSHPAMQQQLLWQQMLMMHMQRAGDATPPKKKEEIPLDLSRKTGSEPLIEVDSPPPQEKQVEEITIQSAPLLVAEHFRASPLSRPPKRNYSQVDLDAAVNDIRNGKLGTRRASVVYGIPRSTLRNKIYKLEAAEDIVRPAVHKRKRLKVENKKIEVEVEKEKIATPSKSRSSSTTPGSEISNGTCLENSQPDDKASGSGDSFNLMNSSPWSNGIWANLFNGQQLQTNMTPEIMSCVRMSDQKKEDGQDWKRSRPKRGQYRKYDKNALDEAVQSVRRGEMSVHRAGSYYGVPHSTLEYKVKERNLMRKKKTEEQSKKSPAPSSPSAAENSDVPTSPTEISA